MSQPENQIAVVSLDQQLVHIEAIEIKYADKRPRYPVFVEFKVKGEHTLTSRRFGKDGLVCWDLEDYQHIPVTTDFSIVVQEVHSIRNKVSSTFEVKSQDTIGKDTFKAVATGKSRVQLKLSCISISPTDAFTELLVKEAQKQLGEKKVLLESLGKTADILAGFMKFTRVASDVHPAVKAAVIAVNALYERCKLQKECHVAAVELMEDLETFLPYTSDVPQDFVENVRTRQLVTQMLDMFCQISRLVMEYSSDGVLGDLLSSHKEKIDTSKNDFKRLKENYDWYIKMEVWGAVTRIERNTRIIERNMVDALMQRLRPAELAFYSNERVYPKGTSSAVFEWVKEWADSDSKVFWLHGVTEHGRGSIAHSVGHMFEQEGRLPGCFFCRRNSGPDYHDPLKVIPTLAYQFSKLHMGYRLHLATVIQGEDEMKIGRTITWQSELLFGEPLARLSEFVRPPKPLIIVIDALDALDEHDVGGYDDVERSRSNLAKALLKLVGSAPWLKVFITSSGQMPSVHQAFLENTIGINAIKIDVNVDHNVPFNAPLQTLEGSSGVDLDRAYASFIWNISEKVGNAQIVRAVLGIIAHSSKTRQLSGDTILHFLSAMGCTTTLKDFNIIIGSLHAVLYRDSSKDGGICIQFSSFLDYIGRQTQLQWFEPNYIESVMARGCIQILVSELKFNMCGLESSHATNDDIPDLESRVSQCISQKLQYSCLYWMKHLAASNLDTTEQSLQDLLGSFLLSPRVLYWIECLSNMGELNAGIDILKQCTEYFKKSTKAFAICTELHMLVSTCYSAIAASTPHLYISALSWASADGLTAKQFYQYFSNQSPTGLVRNDHIDDAAGGPLSGHSKDVNSVAYSPDGRHIVSCSRDNTLRIWDAQTGKAVGEPLTGHSHRVNSVAYSPDGRKIVSGSGDKTLRIWNAQTGIAMGEPLTGHSDGVQSVAYSPDGRHIVSGSRDNTLMIWDTDTRIVVGEPFTGHSHWVQSVTYSPDGRHIVSGSRDKALMIWDAQTGNTVGKPLTGHAHWVWSVAYSPDGRHIVSGSDDETLRTWDAHTGKAVGEPLTGHSGQVRSVAYSPDGRHIVSGSRDKTLMIWDAHTGKAVGEPLKGHSDFVQSVACSPDGRHIVSCAEDKTLRIWDASAISNSLLENVKKGIADDGWLRDTDGHLLLWVPHEYRSHILGVNTLCKMIIPLVACGKAMQIDWKNLFEYSGTSWVNIFKNET